MFMKTQTICLLSFVLLSITSSAQALLDQGNIGNNSTKSLVDNIQNCLQTFVPQVNGELTNVKVDLETEDCPYALTCKVYEGSLGTNLIATEIVSIPVNTPRSMHTITFANPPVLTAGNAYTLALYANCVSGPGYSIWWYKSVNDAYTFGQAYNQFGTTIQPEDPLNDFYFQTYMTAASGFAELTSDDIMISPNPTDHFVLISFNGADNVTYDLLDATGRIIKKGNFESETKLSTSELNEGIYFIHFHNGVNVVSKKIIIDHFK